MGEPDPTLEFLRRLNDPTKWVIRRGVPIFKAHVRRTPKGSYKVSEADLYEIAENTQALEKEHGVVGRITPGHIMKVMPDGTIAPVVPEPPLYGFQRNPRVGKFGPKQEPAILVDEYLFPEHASKADKLPYRSSDSRACRSAVPTVPPRRADPTKIGGTPDQVGPLSV